MSDHEILIGEREHSHHVALKIVTSLKDGFIESPDPQLVTGVNREVCATLFGREREPNSIHNLGIANRFKHVAPPPATIKEFLASDSFLYDAHDPHVLGVSQSLYVINLDSDAFKEGTLRIPKAVDRFRERIRILREHLGKIVLLQEGNDPAQIIALFKDLTLNVLRVTPDLPIVVPQPPQVSAYSDEERAVFESLKRKP